MDGKTKKFVELAMTKATESQLAKRHGCVLTKGVKVVAESCNVVNRSVLCGRSMTSLHAEMMALSMAYRNKGKRQQRKNRNRHVDLYVIRIDRNGNLVASKPCADCVKALQKTGINRVYYSQEDGAIRMEKACTMSNTHQSFYQQERRMPQHRIRF